jgi:hypothetical protein
MLGPAANGQRRRERALSQHLIDAEHIVAELHELAARSEALVAEQRRILEVLQEMVSRTTTILECLRSCEDHDG